MRKIKVLSLWWLFAWPLIGAAEPLPSLPQVPAPQIARAIALSRLPAQKLLRNAFVVPHWIGQTNRFWYRRDTADSFEWILVDAANGNKQSLFDARTLEAAIESAGAQPSDALIAQVSAFLTTEGSLTAVVSAAGVVYRCLVGAPLSCVSAPTLGADSSIKAPDDNSAIFIRGDNLWIRDLATASERALTTDGAHDYAYASAGYDRERAFFAHLRAKASPPPVGILWSPDSRHVLVPRIDLRHIAFYPWLETSPVDDSHRPLVRTERIALVGERPAAWEWWIVDVVSGAKRRVRFPDDPTILDQRRLYRTQWSTHSTRIVTIGAAHRFEARSLFEIDATDGAVRTILTDRTLAQDVTSEDVPFRIIRDGHEALWATVRDDHLHLDLIDLQSGRTLTRLTHGAFHVRAILGVDERAGQVYLVANGREAGDPYNRYVYSVSLRGGPLRLLTAEPGDHQVLDASASNVSELQDEIPIYEALSPDRRFLIYAYSTVDHPSRFAIRRTANGGLVSEYEHTDASALFAAGYKPPQRFVSKSADGQHDLWGLVYRPSDFDSSRQYAVIDAQYAAPTAQIAPHNFNGALSRQLHFANTPATAELGFIVIVVDGRGTPFRSRSFSGPRPDFLATMGLDDHIAFIRALAAQDRSVDLDRTGIVGTSFGGWAVLRAMLQYPDFFKVGVAGTAPGSFYAMPEYPELTATAGAPRYADDSTLRPTPAAVPENWTSFDDLAQVDRLRGKLLMVTGEQDENVLPASSLQFFDRAVAAQKDIWLIQIPNAQHNVVAYPYAMREALSFLLEHLNGTSLPAGTEFPSPVSFPLDPRKSASH